METNRYNQARQTADRRTGGFTLLELMVAVAVISVMVLGFGAVLSQARRVVTTAERRMRADAAASAIARVIRRDMQNISKYGFLYISDKNLMLTTAGAAPSLTSSATGTGPVIGTGSIVSYTLGPNAGPGGGNIFFRQGFVLRKLGDPPPPAPSNPRYTPAYGDCMNLNFAELQAMPSGNIDDLILEVLSYAPGGLGGPGEVFYPPTTVAHVDTMWQLLTPYCFSLSISYTNPAYGTDPDEPFWALGAANTWYNNTNDWPKAVRITFTLTEEGIVAEALEGTITYEVIAALGS